jgi:hypothetical protein
VAFFTHAYMDLPLAQVVPAELANLTPAPLTKPVVGGGVVVLLELLEP